MADLNSHGKSQIFSPYRAIGFVTSHVPLDLTQRGNDGFVLTSVGKSIHLYHCTELALAKIGPFLPEEITIVRFIKNYILASAGKKVYIIHLQSLTLRGTYSEHDSDILFMSSIGDRIVTVDAENNVNVWFINTQGGNAETYLSFPMDKSTFKVSCCVHPNTYLNKILFGSKQGKLQLWNIRTHKLIHEFKGWEEPVVLLEQAPAVDVMAIGLQSGHIVLYNIKYEKRLMSFYQEFGHVTSISFRTDGQPVMATGSTFGHISLWDLEKKKPICVMRHAHDGPVTGMKYMPRQPILVTSAADNALKQWIFDNPDGSERILKCLQGHSAPPNKMLFYGSFGNILLTAGHDNALRYTSVFRGFGCNEFSQGTMKKYANKLDVEEREVKLPPIICMAAESARGYDWDNIVTCHLRHNKAHSWSSQKKAKGKNVFSLRYYEQNKTEPTACDITACGNFTVIGYTNGRIEIYNLQSGLLRNNLGYKDEYGRMTGHKKAIRGVHTDSANFQIISTSADKTIRFWRFKDKMLNEILTCEVPITFSRLHRESSLLAVAFDNFSIQLYDIDTKTMVRSFFGHKNCITDMSWSLDGRWVISSSIDGTIKTWDVPSGRLIDCFLVDEPPTSLALSPTGEYLATTHQDNVGVYLWANKVQYSGTYPTPLPDDYQPVRVTLPTTIVQSDMNENNEDVEQDEKDEKLLADYITPDQLGEELITLSMLPDSRWRNLVNLDLIKMRNKPKEAPKKPKAAPFFLPSISGLETKFDIQKDDEKEKGEEKSKFLQNKAFQDGGSLIVRWLEKSDDTYTKLMNFLKELSPSELEAEFRMLAPEMGGDINDLCRVLRALVVLMKSGMYYELLQAYVGLFLKLHGDLIPLNEELKEAAKETLYTMNKTWKESEQLLNQSTCLVKYFKSATV